MITRDSIETAYSFFHQKRRIYAFSTLPVQQEEIEYAIASYVEQMNPALYQVLSHGCPDFLLCHDRFFADLTLAVAELEEQMLE